MLTPKERLVAALVASAVFLAYNMSAIIIYGQVQHRFEETEPGRALIVAWTSNY